MQVRRLIIAPVVLAVAVSAFAQRGGGSSAGLGSFGFSPHAAPASHFATGIWKTSTGDFRTGRAYRAAYLDGGLPLWWDASYDSSSAPPQVYVMQAPPSAPAASSLAPPTPAQDPLMIELRGDKYVRVSSTTQPGAVDIAHGTDSIARSAVRLVPTVFVFRDGHREESSDYSIYDGVVHARTQFWTDGSWSRQIPLASLNIPESLRVNQERGVQLLLPSAPNEVIVRP